MSDLKCGIRTNIQRAAKGGSKGGGGQCSSGQSVSHRKNEQHEINMKRRRSPLDAASYAASAHCQTDKVLVPNSNHAPSLFPINHHLHTQNTTKQLYI